MTAAKKCVRQKVVAEMSVGLMEQFAREIGASLSSDEMLAFLNKDGRAYEMWKQMMHAGEEYIKTQLTELPHGCRRPHVPLNTAAYSALQ
jgi:hypothetical protein